jgi:3-oxo-5alpha-steroid 4-dehydrogenase
VTSKADQRLLDRHNLPSPDLTADVVVVGLGCAGACAAIEAADAGADVVIIDSSSGGGTSANSGGLIYLGGGTPVQKACGFEDSAEEMFKFLMAASQPGPCEEKIRPFCERSVEHFHWLEAQGVPFKRTFWEEPGMESPTDDCLVYSGGENCHPYDRIAKPAPRAHKPRAPRAAGGFFMQKMIEAARARPLQILEDSRVSALVRDGDRIVGVSARSGREDHFVRARRGVILSTGGFILNDEMVRRYAPTLARCNTKNATVGDDGCGIRMGQAVGGRVVRMEMGEVALPTTIPNRLGRGIFVNRQGQRFINEDTYYGHIGIAALYHQDGCAWLLLDNEIFERNFVGMEPAFVEATIEDLEAAAGFPAGALQSTVEVYNRHAARGEDPLFHKRPEMVRTLATPPYALLDSRVGSAIFATFTLGGLDTTPEGMVLDTQDAVIPGLYAAGRAAALFCGHGYPGSGISLADGTFFGRWAGRAAAEARS